MVGGPLDFSVSPRPLGFEFLALGLWGLGPGLDNMGCKKCFNAKNSKEMSNTCKNFQNPKIARKWLSIETPPSPHFHLKLFYQNDSQWPEMDFKHNFNKHCEGSCELLSLNLILICTNFV